MLLLLERVPGQPGMAYACLRCSNILGGFAVSPSLLNTGKGYDGVRGGVVVAGVPEQPGVAPCTAGSARFHAAAPEWDGASGADAVLEEVGSASSECLKRIILHVFARFCMS